MKPVAYSRADFDHSPMIVFYETTRACDLVCRHCRAKAKRYCHPEELSTQQAKQLIDQLLTFPKPPLLILTGGDPLKRADVLDLVDHARKTGIEVAMTPSATPLVTTEAVGHLRDAGLHRLALSLDGVDPATHDDFRRVRGSFDRTLQILGDARACGLPTQINTTIGRHNVNQVDAIAELLEGLGIVLWSVFFLVPTGRAHADQRITSEQYEQVFDRLLRQTTIRSYAIKTTEAPHYRRFILQQTVGKQRGNVPESMLEKHAPSAPKYIGTNDGKGVMFISHTGEIFPSGFLPIRCGRFPVDSVVNVYQNSQLFRDLRDGDNLRGKCGDCEFRHICGGSRARAFAMTGDPLAAEPDCVYVSEKYSARTLQPA